MPTPTTLSTTVAVSQTGHLLDHNTVHGAVNNLTILPSTTKTAGYTLALVNSGETVEFNTAAAVNCTVPPNTSASFPVGTVINIAQYGAGQVNVVAGAGVTLRTAGTLTTRAQYSEVSVRKRGTDEWIVSGDTT